MNRKITFLGTAFGMPINSRSSAIFVEDEQNSLLLDAGGGHEIIGAFQAVGKNPREIEHIFISHYDSDHILGIVPLVRAFRSDPLKRHRIIFCSVEVKAAIESIFAYVAREHFAAIAERLTFELVQDGSTRTIGDWQLAFFDLVSNKTPQLGWSIRFSDHKLLSFLGDEPLKEKNIPYVHKSDVLLHEAFCVSGDVDRFKPYEKNHGTALEAGLNAVKAQAKMLALFHMEDETLATRKTRYLSDVRKSGFTGEVFVPQDLDILEF